MSDHFFKIGNSYGIMSLANIFKYGGFTFEWHYFCGPTKLNKDGEFAKKQGRKFYNVISKWEKLSKKEKEKTRIYG